MPRAYKTANKRIIHREAGGQFRQSTLEDYGLRTAPCPDPECRAINPYTKTPPVIVGGFIDPRSMDRWERPTVCTRCGKGLPL